MKLVIEPVDTSEGVYLKVLSSDGRKVGAILRLHNHKNIVYFDTKADYEGLLGTNTFLTIDDMQFLLSEMIKIEEFFKPKNPNVSYGC